jgi:hypothetical protein
MAPFLRDESIQMQSNKPPVILECLAAPLMLFRGTAPRPSRHGPGPFSPRVVISPSIATEISLNPESHFFVRRANRLSLIQFVLLRLSKFFPLPVGVPSNQIHNWISRPSIGLPWQRPLSRVSVKNNGHSSHRRCVRPRMRTIGGSNLLELLTSSRPTRIASGKE